VTAVFLDRDGVINENSLQDYVKDWNEFVFLPGAKEALKKLAEQTAVKIFIVSNQAGIGKGVVSAERVEEINRQMRREIEAAGGRVDAIFCCPHTVQDRCSCRKPEPGLLLRALGETTRDAYKLFVVGDALSDIAAGRKMAATTIMVKTGRGEAQLRLLSAQRLQPDHIVEDVSEAVEIILQAVRREQTEERACVAGNRS